MANQVLNKVNIRKATKNDVKRILQIAEQVLEIIKARWAKSFGRLKEFRKSKEFYLKALANPEQAIFVATTSNNEIV